MLIRTLLFFSSVLVPAALAEGPVVSEATVAQPARAMLYDDVSLSPLLTAGLGLGRIGDDLVGDLGAQTFGLRSTSGQWLLQWDGLLGARGGVLANTNPYTSFFGAGARGFAELGYRFTPSQPWSPYLGGRLAANFSVMAHPGTALADLNTLNDSDGFGGVAFDVGLRVAGGVSLLDAGRSALLVGFVQEALIAPGLVNPGKTFTEFGLGGRFDLPRSFTVSLEGLFGVRPAVRNAGLGSLDQTLRVQVGGGLRKTFGNGVWFGVAASWQRDFDHVTYAGGATYDSSPPGTTTVTLSFGVILWRPQ